jgi:hypothetical protein
MESGTAATEFLYSVDVSNSKKTVVIEVLWDPQFRKELPSPCQCLMQALL